MNATPAPSRYFVPLLLAAGAALAGLNWYLDPVHAAGWASGLAFLACLALVWGAALRRSARHWSDHRVHHATDAIRVAVIFAALIVMSALAATFVGNAGIPGTDHLSTRLPMIVVGLWFVFTGNAMPKMLTPLSALRCDPARVQATQRLIGWTWVLMGLAYSFAWAALPLDAAEPLSIVIILFGIVVVLRQVFRPGRGRHREA